MAVVTLVLVVVAGAAVTVAAAAAVVRQVRVRRAPAVLRVDAGPIERVFQARRSVVADDVLDSAAGIRGTHIVRDSETGVLLQVRGRHLGTSPKVDLYVHVELPSDGLRTSYVLTAQAMDPQDEAEAEVALRAFESRLRTYLKRSSGLSALTDPS